MTLFFIYDHFLLLNLASNQVNELPGFNVYWDSSLEKIRRSIVQSK